MSKTVWKYPIELWFEGTKHLELPVGATPLHVNFQNNELYVWALVDEAQPLRQPYQIDVVGTGSEKRMFGGEYLNTFFQGSFVFHAFWNLV